jgi:hypothetical protein
MEVNLNEASMRAARRFGFTYEGTFRQHMVVKGRNRDTAWFSLLDPNGLRCAGVRALAGTRHSMPPPGHHQHAITPVTGAAADTDHPAGFAVGYAGRGRHSVSQPA